MRSTPSAPPRRATNISINVEILSTAKALDINISRAAEYGLSQAIAERKSDLWLLENREALESSNNYVAKHGLPLTKYRAF
ncbi:MAG: type II toxin-antitoxin system CcdA family antitoxin [Rhodocyclaceae bacterium]|nr:type II toxin-antitoxin system CcdA family antitoxin [Rhodocyclaceae bacterium]